MGASLHVRLHPEAPKRRDASGGAGSGCRDAIRSEPEADPAALAHEMISLLRSVRTPAAGLARGRDRSSLGGCRQRLPVARRYTDQPITDAFSPTCRRSGDYQGPGCRAGAWCSGS